MTGERMIGIVGRGLLILDEQCPITKGRCKLDCGDMCQVSIEQARLCAGGVTTDMCCGLPGACDDC